MIGVLRFVGILNAAIWFGASVWLTFAGVPGLESREMQTLLGPNFPYYSGAIGEVILRRYFQLQLFCATLAILHLTAEWLYLGKYPHRLWLSLLLGLCATCLLNVFWLQPKLHTLHGQRFGLNSRPEQRQAAGRAYPAWQRASRAVNLISLAGLAVYFWRVANPPDPTRFLTASKFRG